MIVKLKWDKENGLKLRKRKHENLKWPLKT